MIPCLHPMSDGVILDVHIQPRASRNALAGLQGEALKIRLTSPPVDGAANRLCVEYLAGVLDLPKSDVILAGGAKSRHKRILLRGVTPEEVERILSDILAKIS